MMRDGGRAGLLALDVAVQVARQVATVRMPGSDYGKAVESMAL